MRPARLWQFHGDPIWDREDIWAAVPVIKETLFLSFSHFFPPFLRVVGKSRRSRQIQKSVKPVSICRGAAAARLRRRPQLGPLQQHFSHHCIFSHVLSLFMALFSVQAETKTELKHSSCPAADLTKSTKPTYEH